MLTNRPRHLLSLAVCCVVAAFAFGGCSREAPILPPTEPSLENAVVRDTTPASSTFSNDSVGTCRAGVTIGSSGGRLCPEE